MSPSDVHRMESAAVVSLLADSKPNEETLAWLASVIADPVKVEAVSVLARRYEGARTRSEMPAHVNSVSSVVIDPERFRRAVWRRRLPMREIGQMVNRCDDIAYSWCAKRRINYYTLDAFATALGENIDALIAEICAPEEMERLGF